LYALLTTPPLRKYVTFLTDGRFRRHGEIGQTPFSYQVLFFATYNANRSAWQLKSLSTIAKLKNGDTVVIAASTCAPYDLLNTGLDFSFPFAYLATFEFTPPAPEAATRAISVEAKPVGKVPVFGGNVR
jgi:hypothetical protein